MLVVADGMGGHAAGELASATAVATFAELDREPPATKSSRHWPMRSIKHTTN